MKHYSKWLYSAMAVGMLASCSNDDIIDDNTPVVNDGPGYYMNINVVANGQSGTRSYTDGDNSSNDETEAGYAKENNVSSLYVVLAKPVAVDETKNIYNYEFIAASMLNNDKIVGKDEAKSLYVTKSKFSREDIDAYYTAEDGSGFRELTDEEATVAVFVICNPNKSIKAALATAKPGDTDWVNTKATIDENEPDGSLWTTAGNGSFVMSNYEVAKRKLPKNANTWSYYTTEDNAFDLSGENSLGGETVDNLSSGGNIKVHRLAARFDFKDGSPNKDQKYPVVNAKNADGSQGETLISVQLTDMSLINMNNAMHYFHRVSDNGLAQNSVLLGAEKPWYTDANGTPIGTPGNYIVDAYAAEKQTPITTGFSKYMKYHFFDDEGNMVTDYQNAWSTSKISDVLKGMKDNYKEKEYHIWRYATENVISNDKNQTNGWSTGVVFRGKMIAEEAALNSENTYVKNMAAAVNGASADGENPWLFKYGNNLLAGWEDMKNAAIMASYDYSTKQWDRNNGLYLIVFGNGGAGKFTIQLSDGTSEEIVDTMKPDENCANKLYQDMLAAEEGDAKTTATANFKKAVTDLGVAIYEASNGSEGWGYYCNYIYWNRHNNNNLPGIMGPMEFAVVRNNVYKLSVTMIRQLGHPTDPINDPDPLDPENPDEPVDIYMSVNVEIVPWVVRINDIIL